jgi:hypothetical protein
MKRALLVLAIAIATACGQPVDVAKAVRVESLSTRWLAAGVVDGKNKIVPAVSFKLKNVSGQTLTALQVNAVFRRVDANDEIGSDFRPVAGSSGLMPDATTGTIALTSPLGYTGTDPHDALLQNSQFVNAKVELFVKAGSGQWTRMSELPINRHLIAN